MGGSFFLRQAAETDLEEIWCHTLQAWGSEQADQYIEGIISRFGWLAKHPQLGKPRTDIKPGYLCFPEGQHLIFYRRQDSNIEILAVVHQRMDYLKSLTDEP
jgi:toxin ParE1/3/4